MSNSDRYYYNLGRHQAVIELNAQIPKTKPVGIEGKDLSDWWQGYNEMSSVYHWRREPIDAGSVPIVEANTDSAPIEKEG